MNLALHLAAARFAHALAVLVGAAVLSVGSSVAAAHASNTTTWLSPTSGLAPPHVLADFDPPERDWHSGHRGVDLAAGAGVSIYAAGAGTVAFSGTIAGRGVVSIRHGNLTTTYEPVTSYVAAGQRVAAGESIGAISGGGHCSMRCLHWGVKRDETYLDPLLLLGLREIVLKPVDSVPREQPQLRSGEASPARSSASAQPASSSGSPVAVAVGATAGLLALGGYLIRRR